MKLSKIEANRYYTFVNKQRRKEMTKNKTKLAAKAFKQAGNVSLLIVAEKFSITVQQLMKALKNDTA